MSLDTMVSMLCRYLSGKLTNKEEAFHFYFIIYGIVLEMASSGTETNLYVEIRENYEYSMLSPIMKSLF